MNDSGTTAQTAGRALAQWWAQQLGCPTFKMDRDDATGQDRFRANMASMMMGMLADRHPVSEEQGQRFVESLASTVDALLDGGHRSVWLHVDYGPDLVLAQAADVAGIHYSRFPIKTGTLARRDHVTTALGYGAKSVLIWHEPGWAHPACNQQRYEEVDGRYQCRDEVCTLPRYHVEECGEWKPDSARCAECGNSYTWHYGRDEYAGHSWNPAGAS